MILLYTNVLFNNKIPYGYFSSVISLYVCLLEASSHCLLNNEHDIKANPQSIPICPQSVHKSRYHRTSLHSSTELQIQQIGVATRKFNVRRKPAVTFCEPNIIHYLFKKFSFYNNNFTHSIMHFKFNFLCIDLLNRFNGA